MGFLLEPLHHIVEFLGGSVIAGEILSPMIYRI
jgi:hypothetical protein